MMRINTVFAMVVLLGFSSMAQSAVFKCIDESGKKSFSDRPCPEPSQLASVDIKNEALADDFVMNAGGLSLRFCRTAIRNVRYWLDNMDENGYVDRTLDRDQIGALLKEESCQSATEQTKSFFTCVANKWNHLATCSSRHL